MAKKIIPLTNTEVKQAIYKHVSYENRTCRINGSAQRKAY